ncbi:MAG: DUF3987 domain-containing protein [Emcibacteraceae bacterium]|nr:DUF3987 domain-containing protein [Emcibacteraceae bacterium]
MNSLGNIAHIDDPYQYAVNKALELDVMPARIAIDEGFYNPVGAIHYWREPTEVVDIDIDSPEKVNLVKGKGLLTDMAWAVSKAIQFPVNTAYAHSLGVVASAMSKSFSFRYGGGSKPVNLYVVTAQPPSTGKSGVNEAYVEPVHLAFEAINKTAKSNQSKFKAEIFRIKAEIKNARGNESVEPNQILSLEEDLVKAYANHDKHVIYTYALDDATPEALTKVAFKQNGLFNIISAEADAINVVLGGVYSDKKANYGIFLKGWDAERHQVARASQETMSGKVIGNIAVIAQDESIKTILEAGELGRGISERFLIVREPTNLGKRKFGARVPIDPMVRSTYDKTIFNLVRSDPVEFDFTDESHEAINEYRKKLEPEMGDNGLYSNNMMRGFIGKSDKQIMKKACVLHGAEHWQDGGKRSSIVEHRFVLEAMELFENFIKGYVDAADQMGFTGQISEYKKVEERLQNYAMKGRMTITISQLRSALKDVKPFSGTPNLTSRLRDTILPTLEDFGVCIVKGNKVYINPYLKG